MGLGRDHKGHKSDENARVMMIFVAAFAVRLCLQFTSLPDLLYDRVEFSTPVSSHKTLKEGLFLYKMDIDPYDGGVCHQAPILLALMSAMDGVPFSSLFEKLLYSSVDLLTVWTILDIASSSYMVDRVPSTSRIRPWVMAAVALFNPFSILVAVSRSSALFTSLAIVTAITNVLRKKSFAAMFCLAFAAYLSVYPVLLIAPMTLLVADIGKQNTFKAMSISITTFTISIAAMFYASYMWLGSWNFVWSNYSIVLFMTDLTPNIGLWWYFFTEMFEDFRNFFLVVFQLHLLIYVMPLCIQLRRDPLFVYITLCGLAAIFKPYPSIEDTHLYFTLLMMYPHLFQHTRYLFLVSCALLYCCIFGPAFYYLWIYAGSGNANFFYAITLVWNLAQGILLSDTVFGNLKDEWEREAPDERQGKNLEVVQI